VLHFISTLFGSMPEEDFSEVSGNFLCLDSHHGPNFQNFLKTFSKNRFMMI